MLNLSSIGQPYFRWDGLQNDLRAQYDILEIDETGVCATYLKKITFEIAAEVVLAKKPHLPYLELHRELLETGVLHIHDDTLLALINDKLGYQRDVKQYLENMYRKLIFWLFF